jgi:hypothetical protein
MALKLVVCNPQILNQLLYPLTQSSCCHVKKLSNFPGKIERITKKKLVGKSETSKNSKNSI